MSKQDINIVVVGAGVLGLSCAVQLAGCGCTVTIVAKDLPGDSSIDYASPWAGAHFRPSPAKTPAEKIEQQFMRDTYTQFEEIASNHPESGVAFVPGVEYLDSGDSASILDPASGYVNWPGFRVIPREEYPEGHKSIELGVTYRCWVLNSPIYLQWLKSRAEGLGVNFVQRQVNTLEDAVTKFLESTSTSQESVKRKEIVVVNATGRGLDDPASFPSRGQFIHVANKCSKTISHHWADGSSTVIIPRPMNGGTIIGGTKEPNEWSEEVSQTSTDLILRRVAELEPELVQGQYPEPDSTHGFDILEVYVARRPMRHGGLRLESDTLPGGAPLIHCYGAGASGFKISWGVAKHVQKLVSDLRSDQ